MVYLYIYICTVNSFFELLYFRTGEIRLINSNFEIIVNSYVHFVQVINNNDFKISFFYFLSLLS